jgi:hypothetical protein
MRPQRGSREMSSIGAKVQFTPAAAASSAATRAPCLTRPGFQLAACPSGNGMTVLKPWMTSRPTSNGMPRRLSSTAMRCNSFTSAGSTWLRTEPMRPSRRASRSASGAPGPSALTWFIWPIFSARLIRPSSAATRSSVSTAAGSGPATALLTANAIATSEPRPECWIAQLFTLWAPGSVVCRHSRGACAPGLASREVALLASTDSAVNPGGPCGPMANPRCPPHRRVAFQSVAGRAALRRASCLPRW